MKLTSTLFALLAVTAFVGLSYAQETSQESEKAEQCQGACPVSKAMEALPAMTYKVGDEETCCGESAAKLAKKSEMPIHFVVAKKSYEDKEAAYTALVEKTEAFVNEFLTPCKCEVSGTTTVAGKSCGCPVEAGHRTELVKTAAEKVQMSFAVGDKECHCPMEAAKLAKDSGKAKEFVVAGEKTSCEMTARLNLARAKYKAAVEALAAAEKKAAEENDG